MCLWRWRCFVLDIRCAHGPRGVLLGVGLGAAPRLGIGQGRAPWDRHGLSLADPTVLQRVVPRNLRPWDPGSRRKRVLTAQGHLHKVVADVGSPRWLLDLRRTV